MRLFIRPIIDPTQEIDVTQRVVGAIAHEIWSRFGGCDALNWLEAERNLAALIAQIRDDHGLVLVVSKAEQETPHDKTTTDDIRQELGFAENRREPPRDARNREHRHRTDRTQKRRPSRRRVAVSA